MGRQMVYKKHTIQVRPVLVSKNTVVKCPQCRCPFDNTTRQKCYFSCCSLTLCFQCVIRTRLLCPAALVPKRKVLPIRRMFIRRRKAKAEEEKLNVIKSVKVEEPQFKKKMEEPEVKKEGQDKLKNEPLQQKKIKDPECQDRIMNTRIPDKNPEPQNRLIRPTLITQYRLEMLKQKAAQKRKRSSN